MSLHLPPILIAFTLWFVALAAGDASAQAGRRGLPPMLVTAEVLQAKIVEVESKPELDAKGRAALVALYRDALSNLKKIDAHTARAEAFAETVRTAPRETELVRQRTAALQSATPPPAPAAGIAGWQIERDLRREEADLAAVQALAADIERQLAYQENRPTAIRQALARAQEQQRAIAAALQSAAAADDSEMLAEARRWSLETRYVALSTLIQALDGELLSLPIKWELLGAERDEKTAKVERISQRVKDLKALSNAWRLDEARRAEGAAEEMRRTTADLDPTLLAFAERNVELARELSAATRPLETLEREQAQAIGMAERIRANHRREQAATEISALSAGLGPLLLAHRQALPDLKLYERRAGELAQRIAEVNVRRLRYLDEVARFADRSAAVAELAAGVAHAPPTSQPDIRQALIGQRQALLDQQLATDARYLDLLRKLRAAENEVLETARSYDSFLEKHLFWLDTQSRTQVADFLHLPAEIRLLLTPERWSHLAQAVERQVVAAPVFWLGVLLSLLLAWKQASLASAIEGTARQAGQPARDGFRHTLHALAWTLLKAAPFPLLLGATGWLLRAPESGSALAHAFGGGLIRVSLNAYVLLALREICLPGGLATAHLQWPEPVAHRLRVELGRLFWLFIPANLVGRLALDLNPASSGGVVARLALLLASVGIALFVYRIFHPARGVLTEQRRKSNAALFFRLQPIWFAALVAAPFVVLVSTFNGYVYPAVIMMNSLLMTFWLACGMVLLHGLAWRWLTLLRQRAGLRSAGQEGTGGAVPDSETATPGDSGDAPAAAYAELDLAAITEDSRELLGIFTTLLALAGLLAIWSAVFPALRILDDVTLWYGSATIDGEDRRLPITLADLGLALIYLLSMLTFARRLPAVLDVILLERFRLPSGSRYTVTTLTTYGIVAGGTLLTLNTLGAQWSQVQWLVAALSVGIGFGLQEIVANFISGLIILFERPVRVGDLITVGNTDGVVTKIRIRATTIRNADRKELVVPNKEFITGRLLNWSLSDQITRVVVSVGVAYGTDVDRAHALMREAADEHPHILADPPPSLSFDAFGDNSLMLTLRAFVDDLDHRSVTMTDLHKAINRKFEQAGVVMAFPQRDLHFDPRSPLRVRLEDARPAKPDTDTR
ncbi:mechanosensitive ion channel domain-containing protein [Accumulibacter sp.]|uniref:mechanosensitive ion channel domain-containing protein n=1 Tax=Accumulibacter sp. TaxID=2053492 RepID=UPI00261B1F7F|nr:mechanosensitive ion channel domain-containing protein [Accumulibacter sp.]